ncbi:hypothetical protein HDU91_004930 [Kappamyces sp. JEL0680]|nr:hypothetical protein HDU91_004930 [Kappamyces sp. JEL0680]
MELDSSPVTLTIKVNHASNCKGSKASLNSFVRVQFADFDFKDSNIVSDSLNPEYNLAFEQSFTIDESLVEVFANKTISFSLHEALPKEKTALLGTGELSLYKHFLKYFKFDDAEASIPECPLRITQSIPINYANPKMLTPNQEMPVLAVEVILSKPLLSPAILGTSTFLTIALDDLKPVPEDWSLREGTEKDPNSSMDAEPYL